MSFEPSCSDVELNNRINRVEKMAIFTRQVISHVQKSSFLAFSKPNSVHLGVPNQITTRKMIFCKLLVDIHSILDHPLRDIVELYSKNYAKQY